MPVSYKKTKPGKNYDNIIIGSGISGIGLAAILAKQGQSSLILERHYTPGGFTHVFKRRDYEWDVGVHYVGRVHQKRSLIRRIFDFISESRLEWAEMPDIYEKIIFGNKVYEISRGKQKFKSKLKEQFNSSPDQKSIDDYIDLVFKAAKSSRGLFARRAVPRWINNIFGTFISRSAKEFFSKTTLEVLHTITKNQELIGVLTGQFGDYGLQPGKSSFIMHAMLVHHYLEGGNYPVGGSAKIFNSIEPTINAAGGEVFVNAEVDEILIEKNRTIGVRMVDGFEIMANRVVSSAGLHITYNKLLKSSSACNSVRRKINQISSSVPHLCLYIGFKHTPEELNLPKSNLWIYPESYDHDQNIDDYLSNPENAEFPVVYISFPASKDPDFQNRYPGRSTIEIITLTNYSFFKKWESAAWKNRGEEYESLKDRYAQSLLKKLYEHQPQLEGKVDYYELSTPLSTRHFVNYEQGEIYGLEHSPERFSNNAIHVKTPIENLYLTGQDIVSCGIAGALMSAVITSSVITRKNMIKEIASLG